MGELRLPHAVRPRRIPESYAGPALASRGGRMVPPPFLPRSRRGGHRGADHAAVTANHLGGWRYDVRVAGPRATLPLIPQGRPAAAPGDRRLLNERHR